ncbi:hypothetical protein BD770DRAFT_419201 [Pilaira anomala]|nr:hypothetical protein BD770DRAFT_419201 [Pilaira anomala]
MHKVIGAALLLDKLKVTLLETYRANSTLLKLEHFVSMALVYMGICSRLYVLSHDLLTQLNECYQILLQWSKSFPSGFRHKEKIEFAAANNLECDKDTLKKARNQFAENRLKSKSCHQHKIHLESYMANPAVMEKVLELKKELNIDENADDNLKEFEDLGEIIQR